MNIKVTETMYLLSDPLNIIVAEKNIKQNPKEGEDPVYFIHKSFHNTVSHALQTIFEREVKKSQVKTWEGLSALIVKQNKLLAEINEKLTIKG